jgi:hypothetical protein
MTFDKPTTGKQRMAGDYEEPQGPPVGGVPECSPVSTPPERKAGHDRCSGGSKPPHVGERWRHLRTGITATVVYRLGGEGIYVDRSAEFWPIDLFMARWERV